MGGFAAERGGAGGIEVVAELPRPRKGAVVYVKEDYPPSGFYELSDFNIELTAQPIAGGYIGYGVGSGGVAIPGIAGLNQIGTTPGNAASVILRDPLNAAVWSRAAKPCY